MSWKNIKLIFQREVRDQLRDRRTLFMIAVLPLLLYPALGIGMVQMTVTFSEQPRRVIVVGADQLPEPSLLAEGRFNASFFDRPGDIDKLEVATDLPQGTDGITNSETRAEIDSFLKQTEERRERLDRLAIVQTRLDRLNASSPDSTALLQEEQVLRKEIESWFAQAPAQVLIVFPQNFLAQFQEITNSLAQRDLSSLDAVKVPRPLVVHNSADEKSQIAYQRIKHAIQNWNDALLDERLRTAGLPLSLPHPIPVTSVDLAEASQIAANVWSKIFPALLVIMSVTGAFYPAIDLGAGEKERGTMETLLISPATRTEIVLGKFLTVMLFSFSTALLNLMSMGFTGRHILSAAGAARAAPLGDLSFPPFASLMWVVLLAIPLAALFSALSLAFAMFAKSSKEGQYYLTPLLLVTMGLTVFCLNPGVELTPYYSVLPVTGPALLLKSLLRGGAGSVDAALYAMPVLLTSTLYSILALWWAIDQFQGENILFREAERFELRLWFRHLLREKEETPSFSEAVVCFVLIAFLQFVLMTSFQNSPDFLENPHNLVVVQLIWLIATVGAPAMLMAVLLTSNPIKTLKLSLPDGKTFAAAIVLAFTLLPIAMEFMSRVGPYLPPPPPGAERLMGAMGQTPLWLSLAAFALAPAVCEELAFRGFILTGLQRSRHRWLPIVISAVLFGVIHMIPRQQLNASLLGLVIGLIAVRSNSLLPGVVFHAIFNGIQVLASRLDLKSPDRPRFDWLVKIESEAATLDLAFRPGVLIVCAIVSAALITWLVRMKQHGQADEQPENLPDSSRPLATRQSSL